jgi:hypothetical protein
MCSLQSKNRLNSARETGLHCAGRYGASLEPSADRGSGVAQRTNATKYPFCCIVAARLFDFEGLRASFQTFEHEASVAFSRWKQIGPPKKNGDASRIAALRVQRSSLACPEHMIFGLRPLDLHRPQFPPVSWANSGFRASPEKKGTRPNRWFSTDRQRFFFCGMLATRRRSPDIKCDQKHAPTFG